jgi:hypothetical protein
MMACVAVAVACRPVRNRLDGAYWGRGVLDILDLVGAFSSRVAIADSWLDIIAYKLSDRLSFCEQISDKRSYHRYCRR